MKMLDQCPICSGELEDKEVEKLLRGGQDVAVLHVAAQVCLRCGERLYDETTVRRFEAVRAQLHEHETADFVTIGKVLQAA